MIFKVLNIIIISIILPIVLADEVDDWKVYPNKINVYHGGRIRLEIRPPPGYKPQNNTSCAVDHGPRWHLPESEPVVYTLLGRGPDWIELGRSPSGGCYLVHSNVTLEGFWWILANQPHSGSVYVSIHQPVNDYSTLQTKIGSKETIKCASSGAPTLHFCQILNTTNQVVSNDCSYTIDPVRSEHAGNWTCLMTFQGIMDYHKYTISLILQDPTNEYVEGKMLTEDDRTHLQCTLVNADGEYKWCRAISPQGKMFLLSPGVVHGRYSSVYTELKSESNICSLEIVNLTKSDHGLWKIEMVKSDNDYTGCFLNVPNSGEVHTRSINREPTKTVVRVGENLELECSVPWPSSYCYAINPDGGLVNPNDDKRVDRLLKIGVCMVTVTNVTLRDAGKWVCALGTDDGSEDEQFYFDVTVITDNLIPRKTDLVLRVGDPGVLLCKSPTHRPLKYCRFIDPTGKGFSIKPNKTSTSRYSYYGAGLEEGECGVRINEVIAQDVGNWTCVAALKFSHTVESTIITVSKVRSAPEVIYAGDIIHQEANEN